MTYTSTQSLVITIIVLLILAGISIQMLTGQNGILNQATSARENTIIAGEKEAISLAWNSLITDKVTKGTEINPSNFETELNNTGNDTEVNSDGENNYLVYFKNTAHMYKVDKNGKIKKSGPIPEIIGNPTVVNSDGIEIAETQDKNVTTLFIRVQCKIAVGNITGVTATKDSTIINGTKENDDIWLISVTQNGSYTIKITGKSGSEQSELIVSEPVIVDQFYEDPVAFWISHPANEAYIESFGKLLSGNLPEEGKNWRLFYADNERAYIISDNIGNQNLQTQVTSTSETGESVPQIAKQINPLYTNWKAKTNNSINNSIKATCYLTKEENWNSYKIQGINDCWVIGGPSLEMFIASYNATHSTNLDCIVESSTSTGYKIRKNSEDYSDSISNLASSQDIDQVMYFESGTNNWLVSPFSWSNQGLINSTDQGKVYNLGYQSTAGIRPIVSIPLSHIGSEEGKIQITDSYFPESFEETHPANELYKSSFGKLLSGNLPTAGSNWRLFYADNERAYIISDNIGNQNLQTQVTGTSETGENVPKIAKQINPLYTNWKAKTNNSIDNSIKATCYLTKEENWNSYKIKGISDCWAIGGPSLEMFVASYNATHSIHLDCIVENSASVGYKIRKNSEDYSSSTSSLSTSNDIDQVMYFKSGTHNWLASPFSSSNQGLINSVDQGKVYSLGYQSTAGIRPIVSFPLSYIGVGEEKIRITDNY